MKWRNSCCDECHHPLQIADLSPRLPACTVTAPGAELGVGLAAEVTRAPEGREEMRERKQGAGGGAWGVAPPADMAAPGWAEDPAPWGPRVVDTGSLGGCNFPCTAGVAVVNRKQVTYSLSGHIKWDTRGEGAGAPP